MRVYEAFLYLTNGCAGTLQDGRTPLLHAVQGRQVHSVKLLVQAGAEVDARSAVSVYSFRIRIVDSA
jgi:ankyrin repeat protein